MGDINNIVMKAYEAAELCEKLNLGPLKIIKRPFKMKLKLGYLQITNNSDVDSCLIDRKLFETDDVAYKYESLERILVNIISTYNDNKRRIVLHSTIPIPFMVALGYIVETENCSKSLFKKISVRNDFGKYKVNLIENLRGESVVKIFIGESGKKYYDINSYDFYLTTQNGDEKWGTSKKDLTEKINGIFTQIESIKFEEVNFEIIASPSVSFLIGRLLQKRKFKATINHFNDNLGSVRECIQIQNVSIDFY